MSDDMDMRYVRVSEDGISFKGLAYQDGSIKVLKIDKINTKKETLRFDQKLGKYPLEGIIIRCLAPLKHIKELVITKNLKMFRVSDFPFPNLERIIVEEGAPFYAKGVNLFSKEGKLLNFFHPGRYEEQEESLLPFDPLWDEYWYWSWDEYRGKNRMQFRELLVPVDTLTLGPEVKYFNQHMFLSHVPRRLVSFHQVKSQWSLDHIEYVKELVITNPEECIQEEEFLKWVGLERIYLPNGNKTYQAKDGILYKDNGTTMQFVPPCHPQVLSGSFRVPEGVLRLKEGLFSNYTTLKKLEMADTVCEIGRALFHGCENLEYVRFGDSITRIPGVNSEDEKDREGAIFFGCENLSEIHFPKSQVVFERETLYGCWVSEINLPEGLKEIQSYAFPVDLCPCKISLPKSLQRVEDRAFYVDSGFSISICAYEGTAKGLLSSIYINRDNREQIRIKILSLDGKTKEEFPLPRGRREKIKPLLDKAWDGDQLCMDAIFDCIPVMYDRTELYEIIMMAAASMPMDVFRLLAKCIYITYEEFGTYLIMDGKMELFQCFLKSATLRRKDRKALLDFCNERGFTQFIPILLEADKEHTKGKGDSLSG